MLPGEKDRRRKEVIARKRLERAQDKDGLHVEMRVIASQMLDFYYANTAGVRRSELDACQELSQTCSVLDLHAGQTSDDRPHAPEDAGREGDQGRSAAVEDEVVVVRVAACAGEVTNEGGTENQEEGGRTEEEEKEEEEGEEEEEEEEEEDESWMDSAAAGNDDGPTLCLPPLSGPHLQAAKKLAQYIRLAFEEKGGRKQRRLQLTVKPNSRSVPDLEAVAHLVAKMEKTETEYATTKRLPQFGTLPQAPGTEAHFAGWHGATTGFGARMLESMGFDLAAHQQGSRSVSGGGSRVGAAAEEIGSAGAGGLGAHTDAGAPTEAQAQAQEQEGGGVASVGAAEVWASGARVPGAAGEDEEGGAQGNRDRSSGSNGSNGSRTPLLRPPGVRRLGGARTGLGFGSAD